VLSHRLGPQPPQRSTNVTTATPTGSCRGFRQPEAAWTRERLIDEAARRLGLDPVELRLRNMVDPAELPCTTRTWHGYDSGDYPLALRKLVRWRAGWPEAGLVGGARVCRYWLACPKMHRS
jgi:CO/xanthine dehydrogenase Mo-binding subunit